MAQSATHGRILYLAISGSLLAVLLGGAPAAAQAQGATGAPAGANTRTPADHTDDWKIQSAMSGAPAAVSKNAMIMDWPDPVTKKPGRMLRAGTNGWTCMPDKPGALQPNAMCMDPVFSEWLDARRAGKPYKIQKIGVSYMLVGEMREDPGKPPLQTGPHVMMILPDNARPALEAMLTPAKDVDLPYVTNFKEDLFLVIPVAGAGERMRVFKP